MFRRIFISSLVSQYGYSEFSFIPAGQSAPMPESGGGGGPFGRDTWIHIIVGDSLANVETSRAQPSTLEEDYSSPCPTYPYPHPATTSAGANERR